MIDPHTFAFHVTYACPLTCAHCCFASSPANKESLDYDLMQETILHLDEDTIRLIVFTGGEPFLLGTKLSGLVGAATQRGFRTRVVTSGYFAKTVSQARLRLAPLVSAGLNELCVSWDEYHEEFVSFAVIRALTTALSAYPSVSLSFNIVQGLDPKWTASRIRCELALPETTIIGETSLNITGRAAMEHGIHDRSPTAQLGPCSFVLTGPTLSAKGHLLACCGVIPDTPRLRLASDFQPSDLENALADAKRSTLLKWIYLRGPYAIAEWISNEYDVPIPSRLQVGGNCEACKILFETDDLAQHIDDALARRQAEIESEAALLTALGLIDADSVASLWTKTNAGAGTTKQPSVINKETL